MAHKYTIDTSLDYEYERGLRRLLNIFLIPLFNILPAALRPYITRDRAANEVADHRTSHHALEVLYHSGANISTPKDPITRIARNLWFGTNNAKAVRNRLRFVRHSIAEHIAQRIDAGAKTIAILSIASGSARAVIESVVAARAQYPTVRFRVVLLDKKPDALAYSKRLAQEHGLPEDAHVDISWREGTAETAVRSFRDAGDTFDIVEMVGLLDYFTDEKVISVSREIRTILAPHGMFITANVAPNKEQPFVTKFVDWKMIYRDHNAMGDALVAAGFPAEDIDLTYEPLKVHIIARAYKR